VSLVEVAGEPLVLREETSGTQQSLGLLLTRAGCDLDQLSPALVVGTSQAVVSAVEAGVGIAFVSNLAIGKSVALKLVRDVAVTGMEQRRLFYCVYRQERVVSRLLSEFIAFVQTKSARQT